MNATTFQGKRLQQGREVRQMTATALAERVGASPGAVSQWEKGTVQPRATYVNDVARVLELPEPFFLRPMPSAAPSVFRFRSRSAATKRARVAAHGRIQWLHEIVTFLRSEIELPGVDVPALDMAPDPQSLTEIDIENAADATRRAWGLRDGPIPDLTRLLESHGIVVARLALNAAELDGVSTWSTDGQPYIVLNSEKASAVRSRFDAAHELGHLVLHRNAPERVESSAYALMERQAHHFAGALLFPQTAVRDEILYPDLDQLVRLKERWLLSIGATVFRMHQLGLISESRKDYLYRQLGSRGWRTWEPLDDMLTLERTTLIRRSYELLCHSGGWTPADIVRSVPIGDYDHEQLAGLPARWMRGEHQNSGAILKLKSTSTNTNAAAFGEPAQVISFPSRLR